MLAVVSFPCAPGWRATPATTAALIVPLPCAAPIAPPASASPPASIAAARTRPSSVIPAAPWANCIVVDTPSPLRGSRTVFANVDRDEVAVRERGSQEWPGAARADLDAAGVGRGRPPGRAHPRRDHRGRDRRRRARGLRGG